MPVTVIGGGSNLLVADSGIRGVTILARTTGERAAGLIEAQDLGDAVQTRVAAQAPLSWAGRYAAERGVLIPIDPDAHSTSDLDYVEWGVAMARKAWLTPAQVLNTRELKDVEEYLAQRVEARAG